MRAIKKSNKLAESININSNVSNNLNIKPSDYKDSSLNKNEFSLLSNKSQTSTDDQDHQDHKIMISKFNENISLPKTKISNSEGSHISEPRPYQLKIFEKIKETNSIVFLETGKGKTFISIMLMKYLLGLDFNKFYDSVNKKPLGKKIVFLVCEVVLVEQQSAVIKNNTPLLVKSCSGKNMKSMKKDLATFRTNWANYDVFVATPQVIYSCLSNGYLTISDIDLLIFDECHHADSNHPYNLLMSEFYFFYKCKDCKIKLPQILGLTASPLKTKIQNSNNIKTEALSAMQKICENLDSIMVVDPEVAEYEPSEGKDGITNLSKDDAQREYIQVVPHTNSDYFEELRNGLFENLLIPFTDLCFKNLPEKEFRELKEEYYKFLIDKFNSKDFLEFSKTLSTYKYLYEIRKRSGLLSLFEKLQRHLFMVIENIHLDAITELLTEYKKILSESTDNETIQKLRDYEDFTQQNVYIVVDLLNRYINYLSNTNKYESNRLKNLKKKIEEIVEEDLSGRSSESHRIIIFVSNRIVADSLAKVINAQLEGKVTDKGTPFNAVSVVGVNKKKSENSFNPNNSVTQLNINIEKFRSGNAQILIGTSTVEEGLDVKSCDVVIVYTELRTAKSYIQMKGRARKANAQFLVFTPNKNKTIENIDNFVQLTLCMRNFFSNDIACDFKREDFLDDKFLEYEHFFIDSTHAKLTLKNVTGFYNEFFQILKNNPKAKNSKQELIFKEYREFIGKGMTTVFEAVLNIDFKIAGLNLPNKFKSIVSSKYLDKASAEAHCYVEFFRIAHSHKLIDNHFKLILK